MICKSEDLKKPSYRNVIQTIYCWTAWIKVISLNYYWILKN